jgi:hypothetical protein
MRAIFLKELRENGKWAALMLVAMAAALAWGLSTDDVQSYSLVGRYVIPLITGFGFPAIAFALGLLQTLQDSSVGRWGFLTHRPITRTQILAAKLLAGVCLYFPTALIPLGVAIYWVAIPGHVAVPFAWQMTLPRLADAIGGLMWYAAGILVGGRQARWIGSRLMPVGMALVGSVLAVAFPLNIGEALLIFAIVLAIILPAAWGAFVSGESFARQPIIARWTTGLCVLIGLFCGSGALAGFSTKMLSSLAGIDQNQTFSNYRIAEDGQLRIDHYTQGLPVSTTDLQGKPVDGGPMSRSTNSLAVNLYDNDPQHVSRERRRFEWGFQREERYLDDVGSVASEHWYCVVPRNTIEGFDTYRKQFIGSLGPAGFIPPNQGPRPFPEPLLVVAYSASDLIASAKTAYEIDLSHRTIVPVFVAEPGDPIMAVAGPPIVYDLEKSSVPFTLIVTRTTVHVFESGKERFHTALSHTFPEAISLNVTRTSQGKYLMVYQSFGSERWGWVDEMDAEGRLLHEGVLPVLPTENSPSPMWVEAPTLLAVPPAAAVWGVLWDRWKAIHNPTDVPVMISLAAFGLITLCATALLVRSTSLSRRAKCTWALFNALVGFPGLMLFLSLFNRIARILCPSCGKRRLVTRERCEHCAAPFAPPRAEGIEVFASTAPETSEAGSHL